MGAMQNNSPCLWSVFVVTVRGTKTNQTAAIPVDEFDGAPVFGRFQRFPIIVVEFQLPISARPDLERDMIGRILAGVLGKRRKRDDRAGFQIERQKVQRRIRKNVFATAMGFWAPEFVPQTR